MRKLITFKAVLAFFAFSGLLQLNAVAFAQSCIVLSTDWEGDIQINQTSVE